MIVISKKQLQKICAFILCIVTIGSIWVFSMKNNSVFTVAQKNDWGLSYQKEGKMPVGNAGHDFLSKYNAVYGDQTEEKVIYLTFDAGFEAGYTPNILDVLKKHNAKAAFFIVGNYLKTSPELVKRMNDEGHIVGNHTYSHPDMSKISDAESFKKSSNTRRLNLWTYIKNIYHYI